MRESLLGSHIDLLPRLFYDGASSAHNSFISLCCLRTLFSLSHHTSATFHVPTLLCRRSVVDAFLSYMLADKENAVVLDLGLRGLTKLAAASPQDFAARICASANATGGSCIGALAVVKPR